MPKIHKLTFNGTDSDSLGIFITGSGTFNAAELDVVKYEIPGRNGDLIVPNNRYKNIEVVYPAFIPGDFSTRVQSIRSWMRSATTYAELIDTYDPTHYRLAIPTGIQEFTPANRNDAANFQLIFDCKPQRFLMSGKSWMSVSTGHTFVNLTQFDALPKIGILGGNPGDTITINDGVRNYTLTCVEAVPAGAVIDCETKNIYSEGTPTENYNRCFTGDFPVLTANSTCTLTFSNGISWTGVISFMPRWWEL